MNQNRFSISVTKLNREVAVVSDQPISYSGMDFIG